MWVNLSGWKDWKDRQKKYPSYVCFYTQDRKKNTSKNVLAINIYLAGLVWHKVRKIEQTHQKIERTTQSQY